MPNTDPANLNNNIYGLVLDWYGPFESRTDAAQWLRYYGQKELAFVDGLYLARGSQPQADKTHHGLVKRVNQLFSSPPAAPSLSRTLYIGESVNVANRISNTHAKLDAIEALDSLWIAHIISQRIPNEIVAKWDERGKYAIDRLVAEVSLIWTLKPPLNDRDKEQTPKYRAAILNQVNLLHADEGATGLSDLSALMILDDPADGVLKLDVTRQSEKD